LGRRERINGDFPLFKGLKEKIRERKGKIQEKKSSFSSNLRPPLSQSLWRVKVRERGKEEEKDH